MLKHHEEVMSHVAAVIDHCDNCTRETLCEEHQEYVQEVREDHRDDDLMNGEDPAGYLEGEQIESLPPYDPEPENDDPVEQPTEEELCAVLHSNVKQSIDVLEEVLTRLYLVHDRMHDHAGNKPILHPDKTPETDLIEVYNKVFDAAGEMDSAMENFYNLRSIVLPEWMEE